MMQQLDLNCDMGELKPQQKQNFDAEIMPFISSCNIACGFHSGSPALIEQTIKAALAQGVQIGAHPSYKDRENFGRQSIQVELSVLLAQLRYQICAMKGMVESLGGQLHHVKPHGALYNDMATNSILAGAFVQLVKEIDPNLKIFALAHSQLIRACTTQGMQAVAEGFADRKYQTRTQLRNRSFQDAVIHEAPAVLQQIEGFLIGKVTLSNSEIEDIKIDSLCLHSDTQGAVQLSQTIYGYLKEKNVKISAIA